MYVARVCCIPCSVQVTVLYSSVQAPIYAKLCTELYDCVRYRMLLGAVSGRSDVVNVGTCWHSHALNITLDPVHTVVTAAWKV